MRWWLKSRLLTRLCIATIATGLILLVFGQAYVPFPNLGLTGRAGVPILVLLPLLVTSVLMAGLANGARELENTATRPVPLYDATLVLAVAAVAAVAGLTMTMTAAQPGGAAGARNLVGYVGAALVVLRCGGRTAAAAAPAGFAMIVGLFGYRSSGRPWFWAWPLEASTDDRAAAIALTAFLVGMTALLLPPHVLRRYVGSARQTIRAPARDCIAGR